MKKLQIPVTEELMNAAKLYAFQSGKTLKDVVTEALSNHISSTTSTSHTTTNTSNTPITSNDDLYVVRKTAKVGKPERMAMRQYNLGSFTWVIIEGCRPHFDADGMPIPFRFTDETGTVQDLDEDVIKELEEELGKPVILES